MLDDSPGDEAASDLFEDARNAHRSLRAFIADEARVLRERRAA